MSDPQIIGGTGAHDAIRRVLRERPPSRVLDCPCGEGILSAYMRDLGWDVHCCDIDAGNMRVQGFPFQSADLNRGLPYRVGEFDTVVCANGLHRLFNPAGAISEFRRVLKPGGRLFLNLNNYASLDRRLRFLVYGSIDNSLNNQSCQQTISVPEANVRVPLLLPVVANLLNQNGFAIVGQWASGRRRSSPLLFPVALLLKFFGLFVPGKSRRRNHLKLTNGNAALPGGQYLLLETIRQRS